jgi:hypothetical protein
MREINIVINEDKTITTNNNLLGNKGDNGITKLTFSFFESDLPYRYVALKNSLDEVFYMVDISSNAFIVDSFYSWNAGTYRLLCVMSDKAITDEDIDKNSTNFVSNELSMTITNNFLEEPFTIREIVEPI